jgi:Flp pilus assembly protein TadG
MLKRFFHDRRGATAVLFTLCLIPVVGDCQEFRVRAAG